MTDLSSALARAEAAEARLAEAEAKIVEIRDDCTSVRAMAAEDVSRAARIMVRLAAARAALKPFADIGQWLFARDLPDDTPMVDIFGIGARKTSLTRGHFKAAHTARDFQTLGRGDGSK